MSSKNSPQNVAFFVSFFQIMNQENGKINSGKAWLWLSMGLCFTLKHTEKYYMRPLVSWILLGVKFVRMGV